MRKGIVQGSDGPGVSRGGRPAQRGDREAEAGPMTQMQTLLARKLSPPDWKEHKAFVSGDEVS